MGRMLLLAMLASFAACRKAPPAECVQFVSLRMKCDPVSGDIQGRDRDRLDVMFADLVGSERAEALTSLCTAAINRDYGDDESLKLSLESLYLQVIDQVSCAQAVTRCGDLQQCRAIR